MYPRNTHAHVFILLADVPKHFLLCLKRVDIDISERAFREYICVCLHIYIYTCMSASPSVHMRLCRAYVCVYQRVRVNAGVNLCVFVLVCMCVCVCAQMPPRLGSSLDGPVYMRVDSVREESRGVRRT